MSGLKSKSSRSKHFLNWKLLLFTGVSFFGVGCGSFSSETATPPAVVEPTPPAPLEYNENGPQAAQQTVATNAACTALSSFYWEIGDVNGMIVSGSTGADAPASTDVIPIASSSKWLYGSFVAESKRGILDAKNDVPFLNFTSGYMNFGVPACPGSGGTIDDCLSAAGRPGFTKGSLSPENVGNFYYDGAHMEKHASLSGNGGLTGQTLGQAVSQALGISVTYSDAQPAGSGQISAVEYAKFLRKLLSRSLKAADILGQNAVCTWHDNDACHAISSPTDGSGLHWHYSNGNWIEDDDSNQAYSSAGAFGYYPWVTRDLKLYGLIARLSTGTHAQEGFRSAQCGRLIRQAFITGIVQ